MHHFVVTEIIDTMNWMYCSSFNIKIFGLKDIVLQSETEKHIQKPEILCLICNYQ